MKLWAKMFGVMLICAVLLGVTPTPDEEVTQTATIRSINIAPNGPRTDVTVGTKFVGYQNQKIEICTMIKNQPAPGAPTVTQSCGVVTPSSPSALMSNTFSFSNNKLPYDVWYAYVEARLKTTGEVLAHKVTANKVPKKPKKPGSGGY